MTRPSSRPDASARSPDSRAADRLRDAHEQTSRRVAELREALAGIIDASASANLDDEHDPEGATVGFERAQVSALLDRERAQLGELEAAVARLRGGTYGVCERCRAEIPRERLRARPATRLCVGCAAR